MTDFWYDVTAEALEEAIKLFPFLLVTYLVLEYLERRVGDGTVNLIRKSGKTGPLIGALCGIFPQCGLAAAAANFYAARVISAGTLMAVFISTSDEMLPILISNAAPAVLIVKILALKVTTGVLIGMTLDFAGPKISLLKPRNLDVETLCRNQDCKCEAGIWQSALRHSLKITLFVFVISWLFSMIMAWIGTAPFARFMNLPVAGPAVAGLIGLVPNCSASVIVTQLYLENAIGFGAMMSGVLSGAGVGLLVLFRVNPRLKENLLLAAVLYLSGVVTGTLIDLWR